MRATIITTQGKTEVEATAVFGKAVVYDAKQFHTDGKRRPSTYWVTFTDSEFGLRKTSDKAEAIAMGKFYGSDPKGMELAEKAYAAAKTRKRDAAYVDVLQGTSFRQWLEAQPTREKRQTTPKGGRVLLVDSKDMTLKATEATLIVGDFAVTRQPGAFTYHQLVFTPSGEVLSMDRSKAETEKLARRAANTKRGRELVYGQLRDHWGMLDFLKHLSAEDFDDAPYKPERVRETAFEVDYLLVDGQDRALHEVPMDSLDDALAMVLGLEAQHPRAGMWSFLRITQIDPPHVRKPLLLRRWIGTGWTTTQQDTEAISFEIR